MVDRKYQLYGVITNGCTKCINSKKGHEKSFITECVKISYIYEFILNSIRSVSGEDCEDFR